MKKVQEFLETMQYFLLLILLLLEQVTRPIKIVKQQIILIFIFEM